MKNLLRQNRGVTLIEMVVAVVVGVIPIFLFNFIVHHSQTNSVRTEAKTNTETGIRLFVNQWETFIHTTLKDAPGVSGIPTPISGRNEIIIYRDNGSAGATTERVRFFSECLNIADDAVLLSAVGAQAIFPPVTVPGVSTDPADADPGCVACPMGQYPIIREQHWNAWAYPTVAPAPNPMPNPDSEVVRPRDQSMAINSGAKRSGLAATFCLASPLTENSEISGSIFGYYADDTKQIRVFERPFLVLRPPSTGTVELIPNR